MPKLFELGLVDMDGVLFDFVNKAFEVHGKTGNVTTLFLKDMPNGIDVEEYLDMKGCEEKHREFWDKIYKTGRFWESLRPYPWYKEVIAAAESVCEQVKILTSPGSDQNPSVYHGKRNCLMEHGIHNEFLPFKSKHLVAAPRRLLIDDNPEQVENWEKHGGHAILFPSVSNKLHPQTASTMFHFGRSLYELEQQLVSFKSNDEIPY